MHLKFQTLKKYRLLKKVADILYVLGMDMTDDSLKGTPKRVAKMYVNEIFSGLNPKNKPKASTFDNKYKYGESIGREKYYSLLNLWHHLLPIVEKLILYISNGNVVGLSKMNRVVQYYAQRPQVQERLTLQIVRELQKVLNTKDVACVIDAKHLCVNQRGIKDISSSTVTCEFGGVFQNQNKKQEFLDYIKLLYRVLNFQFNFNLSLYFLI